MFRKALRDRTLGASSALDILGGQVFDVGDVSYPEDVSYSQIEREKDEG